MVMMKEQTKKSRSPKNSKSELHRPANWLVGAFLVILIIGVTGCGPERSYAGDESQAQFRPPTLEPTATPTVPTPTRAPEDKETPSPDNCNNILSFRDDLTIPDGWEVTPGSTIDKRWEVENSGTCNWSEGYTIQLIQGLAMGSPETQALYPARSGTRAIIRIVFTAPDEPGTYRSAWQAHTPSGQPFGDPFYIEIVVTGDTEEAPPAETAP